MGTNQRGTGSRRLETSVMVLSALGTAPLRESSDPSSRTLGPTQLVSHGFPWLHPNVRTYDYPERAGIPILNGSFHFSLSSSGDISISHSGVSRGHWNVPQTSSHHSTPSPDSSGLFPGLYATNLRPTDKNHYSPGRLSEHTQTIFLCGSSCTHNASELIID